MAKILIITGPQGSGNHLYSKIFAMHPLVNGWKMNEYWEGHHKEPFAKHWDNPKLLLEYKWDKDYYVTSISCPYFRDGKPQIPKYKEFIENAQKVFDVNIAIIGRDQNIIKYQQERVRKEHTTPQALEQFNLLWQYKPYFLSMELFYLYGPEYLKRIGEDLDFPIVYNYTTNKDSNKKYIQPIDNQELDETVNRVSLQES
jgi:hypothetical protein